MALWAFVRFCYKNYLRQHRYLRELIAIVIFIILFEGFLTSDRLDPHIWIVFAVFAIILNLLTAPSLFFFEKGNTLYFLLGKPHGRRNLFLAKVVLIVLVDLFWVALFASIYGLRFLAGDYFLMMPVKLLGIALILLLSTLLLSLAYTIRPQLSWLIFLLLVFGCIVPKARLLPITSLFQSTKLLAFLLPPFAEMADLLVSLSPEGWQPGFLQMGLGAQIGFLGLALAQIALLFYLSGKRMLRKDFV
ncbi:MAG: hypothetical protein D6681_07305 [Calditrichaeota bacterium]|nr:MAG: hypothetical protein D6681_07305 [Calditrichota bacterium]